MKLASYRNGSAASWGIVAGDAIVDIPRRIPQYHSLREALALDGIGKVAEYADEKPDHALKDVILLPPIPDPDKILCIGLNYKLHLQETGHKATEFPTVFSRTAGSQVGAGSPLVKPRESSMFDFEGELALVIGKRCRRVSKADARSVIAGYSCYNDGSARDFQRHTTQFMPGKNFPETGAFGPWLVTPDEIPDPTALELTTRLNGTIMQHTKLDDLIFPIEDLIAYCSIWNELLPGDVIVTGTPGGVGSGRNPPVWMKPQDVVEIDITGIGILRNQVAEG